MVLVYGFMLVFLFGALQVAENIVRIYKKNSMVFETQNKGSLVYTILHAHAVLRGTRNVF
jgi:hypothetical protein